MVARRLVLSLLAAVAAAAQEPLCVVGGGPGGVSLAYMLSQQGFGGEIVLFEREAELGGKAKSVTVGDGTVHELGACYTSQAYYESFTLLEKMGITPLPYDLVNERIAVDSGVQTKKFPGKGMFMDWMTQYLVAKEGVSDWWAKTYLEAKIAKYAALQQYAVNEVFSRADYSQTGGVLYHPTTQDWQRQLFNTTMLDFLKEHDLESIIPFLLVAQTLQGYGLLDEIPAYYGLLWLTPEMFNLKQGGPAEHQPPRSEWQGYKGGAGSAYNVYSVESTLKEGWQEFVKRLAAATPNLRVHYETTVTEVVAASSGAGARVVANGQTYQCGAVVVGTGESTKVRQLVRGMHPDVEAAFAAQKIGASWYVTVADGDQRVAPEQPLITYVDRITAEEVDKGTTLTVRQRAPALSDTYWDTSLGYPSKLKPCTGTGCAKWAVYTLMRHQSGLTDDALKAQQTSAMRDFDVDMTGTFAKKLWPEYFPYFPPGEVEHLYKLQAAQGAGGLFYAGGIAHFESVEMIIRYNKWLSTKVMAHMQGGTVLV